MSRVVMLLSNAFRPDPRVAREAEALARARDNTARVVAAYNWKQESARLVALYRQLDIG